MKNFNYLAAVAMLTTLAGCDPGVVWADLYPPQSDHDWTRLTWATGGSDIMGMGWLQDYCLRHVPLPNGLTIHGEVNCDYVASETARFGGDDRSVVFVRIVP